HSPAREVLAFGFALLTRLRHQDENIGQLPCVKIRSECLCFGAEKPELGPDSPHVLGGPRGESNCTVVRGHGWRNKGTARADNPALPKTRLFPVVLTQICLAKKSLHFASLDPRIQLY